MVWNMTPLFITKKKKKKIGITKNKSITLINKLKWIKKRIIIRIKYIIIDWKCIIKIKCIIIENVYIFNETLNI